MSQAEELLNDLQYETNETSVDPTVEEHIIINNNRKITVPEELKRIAVQYDHNIETVTFDCPRYWDGIDMSAMKVCINYYRADGKPGNYVAKNVSIDPDNASIMHFTWTIEKHVTEVSGSIRFSVCTKKVDDKGYELNHWNTEINTDMYIAPGMNCSETIAKSYPDVIEQMLVQTNVARNVITDGGRVSRRPMISFIDDDCRIETYEVLYKDVIANTNIPYAVACPPGCLGDKGYMNVSQLREMYDGGVEVSCHHRRQYNMDNTTQYPNATVYDNDLNTCKNMFDNMGIRDVISVSYPQGRYVTDYVQIAKKYYKVGFTVENGINEIPYESYYMKRIEVFSDSAEVEKTVLDTGTEILTVPTKALSYVTSLLEKDSGWLIFMTHAWYEYFDKYSLIDLIKYIKFLGIDIVSVSEAVETTGNVIDIGVFKKPLEERSKPFFVVDANGEVWTNSMNLIQKSLYEYDTLNLAWHEGYGLMPSGGKRLYTLSDGTTKDPNRRISVDLDVKAGQTYLISASAVWGGALYVVRNSDDSVNDILNDTSGTDGTGSAEGTVITDHEITITGDAIKLIVSTNLTIQPGGFVVKQRI